MEMLPKMDVATSSFKKKPFKALAIIVTNTPPSPQKTKIEFSLDHFFPWLIRVGGGVIVVLMGGMWVLQVLSKIVAQKELCFENKDPIFCLDYPHLL